MPDVLVKDVDNAVLDALKGRVKQHGRSWQVELTTIPEPAVPVNMIDARMTAERIRGSLHGGQHSDSAFLVAEDRAR